MSKENRAEVFHNPVTIHPSWRKKPVTGVEVGIRVEGETVWSKNITPVFVFLRHGRDEQDIPKPFYGIRIAIAEAKARRIANLMNSVQKK